MHIPDNYLSPSTCLVLGAAVAPVEAAFPGVTVDGGVRQSAGGWFPLSLVALRFTCAALTLTRADSLDVRRPAVLSSPLRAPPGQPSPIHPPSVPQQSPAQSSASGWWATQKP